MKESEILKLLDKKYHFKKNVVKLSKHETFDHKLAKCLTCIELSENGKNFITEAIFSNGKRADVIDLSTGDVIEILSSEKEESIEKKREEYPLPIIALKAKHVITFHKNKNNI